MSDYRLFTYNTLDLFYDLRVRYVFCCIIYVNLNYTIQEPYCFLENNIQNIVGLCHV